MNSQTQRTVVIDCFPENVERWRNEGYAVVAVDVIRATTTAVTAVAMGRKCYPVATLEQALSLASGIDNPLMVGEIGGDMPEGFEIPNSPATLQSTTIFTVRWSCCRPRAPKSSPPLKAAWPATWLACAITRRR